MKCPKCEYEDMIFSLPANVECFDCGYKYEYKKKKRIKKRCALCKTKLSQYAIIDTPTEPIDNILKNIKSKSRMYICPKCGCTNYSVIKR